MCSTLGDVLADRERAVDLRIGTKIKQTQRPYLNQPGSRKGLCKRVSQTYQHLPDSSENRTNILTTELGAKLLLKSTLRKMTRRQIAAEQKHQHSALEKQGQLDGSLGSLRG